MSVEGVVLKKTTKPGGAVCCRTSAWVEARYSSTFRPHLTCPRKRCHHHVTTALLLVRVLFSAFSVHFELFEHHYSAMSSSALRTSMRMASRPQQRLASIQRQFSSSAPQRKEIRDAYIISASRTPTAVVSRSTSQADSPAKHTTVQRQLHNSIRDAARRNSHQVRPRKVKSPSLLDRCGIHGQRPLRRRRTSTSATSSYLRRPTYQHRSHHHQ